MTFNIRYGSAEDGANAWPLRRDLAAGLIARHSPDVLAIQEGLAFQLEDLVDVLGHYRKLGQHRDGGTAGEFSGLYVREDRARIIQWGEFWFSLTPEVPGSVGWDAALPRMAVWADLEILASADTVRVYGTHFDHRGEEARRESARLIMEHSQSGPPAVVMGDLNAREGSAPLRVFAEEGFASAYSMLHPVDSTGTFNGFQDPTGGQRIDHILLAPELHPVQAEIVGRKVGGVWPSDHFAVVATVIISSDSRGHRQN